MSIEDPNILKRIKAIEGRLNKLEQRISYIESRVGRSPPGPPRPPLEPFRFKKD